MITTEVLDCEQVIVKDTTVGSNDYSAFAILGTSRDCLRYCKLQCTNGQMREVNIRTRIRPSRLVAQSCPDGCPAGAGHRAGGCADPRGDDRVSSRAPTRAWPNCAPWANATAPAIC